MRRRRIGLALAIAAGALTVTVAIGPVLLAKSVARRLSSDIQAPVRIGWLSWNPVAGSWTLRGVRVAAERGPAAFSARRMTARVHLLDVLRGDYRIRMLTLDAARVRLRAARTGWELPLPPPAASQVEPAPWPTVTVDWAAAPRAVVRLEPQPTVRSTLRLRQLELSSTVGPRRVLAIVWTRGRLDRGSIAVVGRLRSIDDARRLRLRLNAAGLDLGRVLRLAETTPVGDLRGQMDLRARYDETGRAGHLRRRLAGTLTGRDLALRAQGLDGLWVRRVAVSRFDIDLSKRVAALGNLRLQSPEVWVRRSGSAFTIPGLVAAEATERGPGWTITVATTEATGGAAHHIDAETGQQTLDVMLEHARLGAITVPESPVPYSLTAVLGSGGRVQSTGEIVRRPLRATAHAEVADVALSPLAALAGAPLQLSSGDLSGSADLAFTEGTLEGSGQAAVKNLKTVSPDPARPEDVLAFKEARVAVREARSTPPGAVFDTIEIEWPYVLIDRTPTILFPFSLFARHISPSSDLPAPAVRVDRLRVLGGRIDFRDATLEPPYWRSLANLKLAVDGMAIPPVRVETLRGTALVDELSPLRFEGTIGERTRLVAEVERLALPPFNAYLATALPYTVSSGTVSGRSEIVLERSELEVNNRIVLSRFGLRGSAEHDFIARELGIPLTLALALMKDYRGNIALTLPFGGNLQEPTFSLRSVVMQAIVRAIRGAVLAPLNALGRVVLRDGRIERFELEPIPFSPGERALDALARERVAQVARVLQAHPDLAVHLRGLVATADLDRLLDEAALAALRDVPDAGPLRAFLEARLLGGPPPPLDEPQSARLNAVRRSLPWPPEALRMLAVDRGAAAAAALILDFQVDPARVKVEAPEAPAPEKLADQPGVAVELHER